MITDVDTIISIMKRYTTNLNSGEIGEDDAAAPASGGGGAKAAYPTVTKWETGLTRGPANQIANTKWSDIVKLTRGKANTLL